MFESNFRIFFSSLSSLQSSLFPNGLNELQAPTYKSTGRRENSIMLNNNNNKMDIPLNNMQDAGRCSPINGNNDHGKNFVSFGFTQEQVECVCEVSDFPFIVMELQNHFFCIWFYERSFFISIRYCNMPEILNAWVDFYGLCLHVISYNWTNRSLRRKQWLPFNAATIKNCIICSSITSSRRTIMPNYRLCGWKRTTLKRKNCVAVHLERSVNTESDANFHCRTQSGMVKRPATVSKYYFQKFVHDEECQWKKKKKNCFSSNRKNHDRFCVNGTHTIHIHRHGRNVNWQMERDLQQCK